MTKILLEIGKPADWNEEDGYTFSDVTDWCEDCFLDRPTLKCHAAIRRPDGIYLDDDFKAKRPPTCKSMEGAGHIEERKVDALYDELLLAVESKFLGESRHETALRYIEERETGRKQTLDPSESDSEEEPL